MNWTPDDSVFTAVWTFFAGAAVVALQSLVMSVKRHWLALLAGMIFGGVGGMLSWGTLQEMKYGTYVSGFCLGVAAVATENILLGVFNFSRQFKDDPIETISRIWSFTPWGRK